MNEEASIEEAKAYYAGAADAYRLVLMGITTGMVRSPEHLENALPSIIEAADKRAVDPYWDKN